MSVKSLVNDPEFEKLSPQDKQGVLASVDPEFKNIGVDEVDKVVDGIRGSSAELHPLLQPDANPMALVAKAAPSNLMKLAGIAGANAPNAANMLLNAIPGFGDPNQITPNAIALAKQPRQILNAIQRVNAVQQGSELKPVEKVPALIGKVGGTALEMAVQPTIKPSVQAESPFTAGIAQPSTALPGSFEQAGQELGAARTAARSVDEASEAVRLRRLLATPAGKSKLAEEGKAAIEAGHDLSVTQLEAYIQALGEMQAKGGAFANDYAKAKDMAREMLQWKAPSLVNKLENMATQYAAKGDPKAFPWLTSAINPKVGLLKAATAPAVQNVVGAATGLAMRAIPKISSAVNAIKGELQNPVITPAALTLTADKAKELLKLAKGNKDKARKMARDKGYVIPEIGQ